MSSQNEGNASSDSEQAAASSSSVPARKSHLDRFSQLVSREHVYVQQSRLGVHSSTTSQPISSIYIKVTPEEVFAAVGTSQSINKLREERMPGLITTISGFQQKALRSNIPGNLVLFRFHSAEDSSLQSEAERMGQAKPVPQHMLHQILEKHASMNSKNMRAAGGAEVFYSPFVSTTEDLNALIATSFKLHVGDINLRQDVFERADFISAFSVPKEHCFTPRHIKHDQEKSLSSQEKEICYNTEASPLKDCFIVDQDKRKLMLPNPFRGQININAMSLATSRQGGESFKPRISALDQQYIDTIDANKPIDAKMAEQYREIYIQKECICTALAPLPKKSSEVEVEDKATMIVSSTTLRSQSTVHHSGNTSVSTNASLAPMQAQISQISTGLDTIAESPASSASSSHSPSPVQKREEKDAIETTAQSHTGSSPIPESPILGDGAHTPSVRDNTNAAQVASQMRSVLSPVPESPTSSSGHSPTNLHQPHEYTEQVASQMRSILVHQPASHSAMAMPIPLRVSQPLQGASTIQPTMPPHDLTPQESIAIRQEEAFAKHIKRHTVRGGRQ